MKHVRHTCCCGADSYNPEFIHYTDERIHNPELCALPVKCNCGKDMTTIISPFPDSLIDAVFDFTFQVYRNSKGVPLKNGVDWDFPCPICGGPSKLGGICSYFEDYCCLNCGNNFFVN